MLAQELLEPCQPIHLLPVRRNDNSFEGCDRRHSQSQADPCHGPHTADSEFVTFHVSPSGRAQKVRLESR
jgi:hypothetical protein